MSTRSDFVLVSTLFIAFTRGGQASQVGYIYCEGDKSKPTVPVFLEPCMKLRVGNFSCGAQIEVGTKSGSAVKVITSGGTDLFVNSNVVSQKREELIPVETENDPAPECKVSEPAGIRPPHAVFTPDPEYPEHAPRTRDQRTVTLALMVSADGRPHDVKVEISPSKDFAKKAVEAVKQWRFEPALKDGRPVAVPVNVVVTFRLIY